MCCPAARTRANIWNMIYDSRPRSHWQAQGQTMKKSVRSVFDVAGSMPQFNRPRGPMDKASAYGAGDCRFESCRGHCLSCAMARLKALVRSPGDHLPCAVAGRLR
jgi:hypothetical protein